MAKGKRKAKSSAPDGFSEKSWNKLSETWRSAAMSKQSDELEQDLIKAVRNMVNTSSFMKNDKKLKALSEELKELKQDYTETIAAERAKIDFCVYLFNSRGAPISQDVKKAVQDAEEEDEEASD